MASPNSSADGARPWGVGLTLLFGGVIFLAYSFTQGLALAPELAWRIAHGRGPQGPAAGGFPFSGFSLALAATVGCPVMLGLCGVFVRARGRMAVADYLAVVPVRPGIVVQWVILMLVMVIGMSTVNDLLHHPVPEFVEASYGTAGYLPFFWSALAVCAPVAEEVFFRGFLFAGFRHGRGGVGSAIGATSVLFMLVHAGQYGWLDLLEVGWVGVMLGIARARTGSLLPPLAMHIAMNLASLTLYAVQAGR